MEKKEKKLVLTVRDRLQGVSSLFLAQADSNTLLLQRAIREKIELSPEEEVSLGFKIMKDEKGNPVSFTWDNKNEQPFDPKFSIKELAFLGERVNALDSEKKLTESNLDLALMIKEVVN